MLRWCLRRFQAPKTSVTHRDRNRTPLTSDRRSHCSRLAAAADTRRRRVGRRTSEGQDHRGRATLALTRPTEAASAASDWRRLAERVGFEPDGILSRLMAAAFPHFLLLRGDARGNAARSASDHHQNGIDRHACRGQRRAVDWHCDWTSSTFSRLSRDLVSSRPAPHPTSIIGPATTVMDRLAVPAIRGRGRFRTEDRQRRGERPVASDTRSGSRVSSEND